MLLFFNTSSKYRPLKFLACDIISVVLHGCEFEWCIGIQVLGVGTSLKVTIQRSSESRAFSTRSEEAAGAAGLALDKDMSMTADKYCCYICNVTSPDQHVRLYPVKKFEAVFLNTLHVLALHFSCRLQCHL